MIAGLPTVKGYSASEAALAALYDMRVRQEWEERRDEARATREVYEGNFQNQVLDVLKRRFHSNTYQKLQLDNAAQTSNRIDRDIIKKVSVAWMEGARYWLTKPSGLELQSPEFAALMRVFDFDNLLKDLDEKTELYRRVLVMPSVEFNARTGTREWQWNVHTPETFDLVADPNNPQQWVEAIIYRDVWHSSRGSGGKVKRVLATVVGREAWWQLLETESGKWMQVGQGDNPYGLIPGVLFGNSKPHGSFWLDAIGPILAQVTVNVNAWETYLDLLAAGQVKVLAGPLNGAGFGSGQYLRHAGALDTGTKDAGAFQVLDFTTDIRGIALDKIERPRGQAAVTAGLRADEFSAGNPNLSGEALRILNFNRDRSAMKKRSFLVESLQELYATSWWVAYTELKRMGPAIKGISKLPPGQPPELGWELMEGQRKFPLKDRAPAGDGVMFHVDPQEIRYPETQAEKKARLELDIALGLTSAIEQFMRDNPDATLEQAWLGVMTNKVATSLLSDTAAAATTLMQAGVKVNPHAPEQKPPTKPGISKEDDGEPKGGEEKEATDKGDDEAVDPEDSKDDGEEKAK